MNDPTEGRVVTLYFKVKIAPPQNAPVSDDTEAAQKVADALLATGTAALSETIAGYDAAISTAYFIF